MTEFDFDVIVVGGGVAGSTCAYLLGKEGYEVLLIERGVEPGSKNLSGGVFYCQVMQQIFADFLESAPVERKITRNTLCFLNETSAVSVDYWDQRLQEPTNAVTVLRAKLDPWLAEKCEEVGVTLMPGIKVDELVLEDGKVVGVRSDEDVLRAKVVVAADGVNSFLAQYAGLREKPEKSHLGLGVKSVIRIGEEQIRARFNTVEDQGVAYAIVGDCTKGLPGGGFLYTNKDSVSIGVVVMLEDLSKSEKVSSQVHDHFLTHPFIAPFLADGELLEYGCHLVAEGGEVMQQDLVHDGLVLIGDAAGFTLNTGFTVRGMDLAAGSAQAAAQAIIAALQAEDYSKAQLNKYVENYQNTFVGKDMHTYRKAPAFLEHNHEMYGEMGKFLADTLYGIYNLDLTARKSLVATAWAALRKSNLRIRQLIRIGYQAVRSL